MELLGTPRTEFPDYWPHSAGIALYGQHAGEFHSLEQMREDTRISSPLPILASHKP
jgi:hypothetical protein